ncbi:hypothetical protein [Nonomuraea sp. MG754425]|uniref:hypothetical protein n=1 Tax=Nonomuraea sp. MG754425 TaxID=2570319 RepID=UPI001F2CFD88|nr:hypothetical protein [Nonomuraea sp. MG754425]
MLRHPAFGRDAVRRRSGRGEGRRDRHHRDGGRRGNAIFNATGRRVRDLPITLDKLL